MRCPLRGASTSEHYMDNQWYSGRHAGFMGCSGPIPQMDIPSMIIPNQSAFPFAYKADTFLDEQLKEFLDDFIGLSSYQVDPQPVLLYDINGRLNRPAEMDLELLMQQRGSFIATSVPIIRETLFASPNPDNLLSQIKAVAASSGITVGARALGFLSTLLITCGIFYEAGDNIRLKILAIINMIQRTAFLASNEYLVGLIDSFCSTDIFEQEKEDIFTPTSGTFDFDKWSAKAAEKSKSWRVTGTDVASKLDHLASNLAGNIDSFYGSQAMIGINRIFACVIAKGIVGDALTTQALFLGAAKTKEISYWKGRQDFIPMVSDLLKASVLIIRGVIGTTNGDKFHCNDVYDWMTCARWLVQHEHLRSPTTEDIPEGYVSELLWKENLVLCEKKITSLKNYDPTLKGLVSGLILKVEDMMTASRCAQYGDRPMPFNIGLLSPPGTGKTTYIANAFIRKAARILEIITAQTSLEECNKGICVINQADKFFSAYMTAIHWACVIDEMGAADPDKDRDNQVMTNLTNILGEGNWYINRASIQDKGKDLYRPHINVCISNIDKFGVTPYLNSDAINAFTRRMHVVFKIRVKADYSKVTVREDGSTFTQPGIDLDKLAENDDPTDAVEYQALVACEGNKGFTNIDGGKWMSFREAQDYVAKMAYLHKNKSSNLTSTIDYVDKMENEECHHGFFDHSQCPTCRQWIPTALPVGELLNPAPVAENMMGYHFVDTFRIFWYTMLTYLLWPLTFLWWIKLKLDHYDALRRSIMADVYTAKNMVDRVDSVLTRYCKYKEELVRVRSQGLYAAVGVFTGLAVVATAKKLYDKRKEKKASENRAIYYNSDIVFGYDDYRMPEGVSDEINDGFETEFVGTADVDLAGSKPSGQLSGNPWDHDDGFIHAGAKSQSPAAVTERRLRRNLVVAEICFNDSNKIARTHLFGVKGQYAIGVWHALKHFAAGKASCQILRIDGDDDTVAVNKNHVMQGNPRLCKRIGPDLGIIKLVDSNCFVDVVDHFPVKAQYLGSARTIRGYNIYRRRQSPFSYRKVDFAGVHGEVNYTDPIHGDKYKIPCFQGKFDDPHNGHCGSPLVSHVNGKDHINGIAVCTNFANSIVCYHTVSSTDINNGIETIDRMHGILSPTSTIGYEESIQFEPYLDKVGPLTSQDHAWWLEPHERGAMRCYGSVDIPAGRKPKSKVILYPLAEQFKKEFPEEYQHDLVRPVFNGKRMDDGRWVSPERNALLDMANQMTNINIDHLNMAVDDLVEKLCSIEDFDHDRVWDLETCINGQPNTEAKAMPKNTSAGFGMKGKKYEHLVPDEDAAYPHYMKLTKEAQAEFDRMEERAREGKRIGVVFKTCPKDEPRAQAKVDERKIRIFTLGPMNFYLLCKKYLGAFMAIYTKNFLKTETAGGVNPFSKDWGRIRKLLSKFKNVINGDFSKYDKRLLILLLMAAMTVVWRVKKHFAKDVSEETLAEWKRILTVIATEIANPLVLFERCMMQIAGSLSSGVLVTFLFNDIINSLLIRMAYYHCYSNTVCTVDIQLMKQSFRDNVVFLSLGDDNTYTVSDYSIVFFNFRTVQKYFQSIGMKYTPADKSENKYGSMPIEFATIGKRTWVWNEEYQIWLCPIEKPSIMKMLTIGLDSTEITMEEHERACFSSAMAELSQYGKEEFEARVATMKELRPDFEYHSYEYYLQRQADQGITPWVPYVEEDYSHLEFTPY